MGKIHSHYCHECKAPWECEGVRCVPFRTVPHPKCMGDWKLRGKDPRSPIRGPRKKEE